MQSPQADFSTTAQPHSPSLPTTPTAHFRVPADVGNPHTASKAKPSSSVRQRAAAHQISFDPAVP
ncbi:hypothetical protein DPSP01_010256 [Paraphaeosphaeria sporulosa]